MLTVDSINVRPLTTTLVEVTWSILPTNESLVESRFHVLRSESPEGKFVDISGPLANTFIHLDKVNLKKKFNKVAWRIQVDHLPTGVTVIFPNGTPDEAFRFHSDLERAVMPNDPGPDLIALEIVRRNNLLLRRFTGRLVAFFPVKSQGARCVVCFDPLKKRAKRSQCPNCFGTTFQGGFYDQITVFADFNPSAEVIQISPFGKEEPRQTILFMSNFPLAKPNDLMVEKTNKRWRVVQVNKVTKNRYPVQQVLQVQEIDRSDAEFLLPVDLTLDAPPEDFIGFFPKRFSPRSEPVEGSALL